MKITNRLNNYSKGHFSKISTAFQNGFTLLELMVAISIFAIVSLLTMGGLSNVLDTQAHTEQNMQRLIRFQMAFTIMSRELQQISPRSIRDEYGTIKNSMTSETSDGIKGLEFTHQGRFTLGDTVSLQRVAYYHEDDMLIKKVWRVLDRVEDTEAIKQVILTDVNEVNFSFYSTSLTDSQTSSYGTNEILWQDELEPDSEEKLLAIRVSFKTKDYDELYRVYQVAQ